MRILSLEEFNIEKYPMIDSIINGAVFIYPTDTIYGIGCNAEISKSVIKIRKIKARISTNPFSVIAPSMDWITNNCIVTGEGRGWLDKLPGPYTLVFKLKKNCVAKEVNPGIDSLGVRIPNHWIKDVAGEANVPIITTSVNKSSEDYMSSLEDLDISIKSEVEFMIYEGQKNAKPSKIVDLTGKKVQLLRN